MNAIHSTPTGKPNVFYRLWRSLRRVRNPKLVTPTVVESPPLPTTCTVTDLKVTLVMRQSAGGGRRSSVYRAESFPEGWGHNPKGATKADREFVDRLFLDGNSGPFKFARALETANSTGWLKLGMAHIPLSDIAEIATEELTRVVTIK